MPSIYCNIDDKHIPLYRIMWIADTPHFCGEEECTVEGRYEVRLEQGESVFGTREERDEAMTTLEQWQLGADEDDQPWE